MSETSQSSFSLTNIEPPTRLLLSWLDGNQHRAYPLDESTAGGNAKIPYPLFVDAMFSITSNIDRTRLYISRLVIGDVSLRVYLNGYIDNEDTELGLFSDIPLDPAATPRGTEIPITIDGGTYNITGTLVIGNIESVRGLPATLDIPLESGKIFPGCVRTYDSLLGISVNGEVYTGIVTLEAGTGIEFEYDELNNTLKITSTNYDIPEGNTHIVNDEQLVYEAVEAFGVPIRTINNVFPDDVGNISIVSPTTETSSAGNTEDSYASVSVEQAGLGAISITLSNDNTVTTCDDNLVITVENLMSSVANLNDRIAAIDTAITALDRASSNLAIQLSRY